jgi:acyl-ACP thioesterase
LSDFDIFDHVNNAATWTPVEDELIRAPGVTGAAGPASIRWIELEYRAPIDRGDAVHLVSQVEGSATRVWLMSEGAVRSSALAALT